MPRGQRPVQQDTWNMRTVAIVIAILVGGIFIGLNASTLMVPRGGSEENNGVATAPGSSGTSGTVTTSPVAKGGNSAPINKGVYKAEAAKCTALLSEQVVNSVKYFETGTPPADWQQWAATAALKGEHAKIAATGACKPDEVAKPSSGWAGPLLGEGRASSCVTKLQDGRMCVPAGCLEVEDSTKCAAGASAVGRTLGTETLPPWVVLPTCEVLDKCPGLKGWPAHKHTMCASDKTAVHCLAQLPAPAHPSTVPQLNNVYKPSAFEEAWYKTVMEQHKGQPGAVCPIQLTYAAEIEKWITQTEAWFAKPADRVDAQYDASVFSTMTTTYTTASGESKTVDVPIEPVAGILRHPYAKHPNGASTFCKADAKGGRSLYDWRYLAMDSALQPHFQERYPGRKILLDLGMTWFGERPKGPDYGVADGRTYVDLFDATGVEFDLVYGWEPKEEADTLRFYRGVSSYDKKLVPKYCNVNKLSVPDLGHADNAVELMAQLWRPGDYIVFKLDIDHGETELAILKVLDQCPGVVAELIFEYHCNVPEVVSCCWGKSVLPDARGRYDSALNTFRALREKGIRAHVWV